MSNSGEPFPIKVRTLGEFVFCQRAGILSSLKSENEEPECDQPNLDFLPQYGLRIIEEQLGPHLRKLAGSFLFLVVGLIFGGISLGMAWKWAVLGAAVAIFFAGRFFRRELIAVLTLASYRRQAMRAEPSEPPVDLDATMPVNWWNLLKTGFDSIPAQESLRDEDIQLAGKPWRVLRKGSLRIPVIKLESAQFEAGRYWVYRQHEIRLAAYAHLLETCERGEVPYGIALFGDSFDGVAIPITAALKEEALRQLASAREVIREQAAGVPPPPPSNTRICSGCPFGKPTVVTVAEIQSSTKKVHGVTAHDGKAYHSECGDLFGWTPAHELAKRKGLVPEDA